MYKNRNSVYYACQFYLIELLYIILTYLGIVNVVIFHYHQKHVETLLWNPRNLIILQHKCISGKICYSKEFPLKNKKAIVGRKRWTKNMNKNMAFTNILQILFKTSQSRVL